MKMVRYCPYTLSRKFYINGSRVFDYKTFSRNFSDRWKWSIMGYYRSGSGFAWSMRKELEL